MVRVKVTLNLNLKLNLQKGVRVKVAINLKLTLNQSLQKWWAALTPMTSSKRRSDRLQWCSEIGFFDVVHRQYSIHLLNVFEHCHGNLRKIRRSTFELTQGRPGTQPPTPPPNQGTAALPVWELHLGVGETLALRQEGRPADLTVTNNTFEC